MGLGEREDGGSLRGETGRGFFFFFPSCLSISHPLIHISPTSFILNLAFPICSSLSLTHTHTHTHKSTHTDEVLSGGGSSVSKSNSCRD